jgi:RNA polymerase sigma-70 factor (ECF subfamily)
MIDPSERGAWREVRAKLRPFVARRVPESDVDDVLQDIFLRMQRGLPALQDEERFGAWAYHVARSAVVDHLRSSARRPIAVGEPPEHEAQGPEDDRAVEREVAGVVALFVAMMPSPYREALTLTELEGLSQAEAARMLGISVSGMKSRVQRGRRKLRSAIEDCCTIALDARCRVVGCEPRPDGKLPEGCCGS